MGVDGGGGRTEGEEGETCLCPYNRDVSSPRLCPLSYGNYYNKFVFGALLQVYI